MSQQYSLDTVQHKVERYDPGNLDRVSGDRWVTMSNALTRAGHGLTLAEKRLVMLAVSKLDSRRASKPGEVITTRVTAHEYAEVSECAMPTAYQALQDAAKNLFNRKITFFESSTKRNKKTSKPHRTEMRWVGRCTYLEDQGCVELSWWPELLPSLIGLKMRFTSYQLKQASALRSIYTWRLLELLMRFQATGWAEYSIEDYTTAMNASEKQCENFNNIKRRMIEPAVKELTAKNGWLIEWWPIKKGRRVAALRFEFQRNPQGQLQI
jgi:plasmid replication initiation protein